MKSPWRSLIIVQAIGSIVSMACGITPVDADGCRQIEYARCEVAPACPALNVTDVDGCKRFYRDQCLHGLTGTDPGAPKIDQCVDGIQQAGACAAKGGTDCVTGQTQDGSTDACGVIANPERLLVCSFLIPAAPVVTTTTTAGAGGATATSTAAGTGGSG